MCFFDNVGRESGLFEWFAAIKIGVRFSESSNRENVSAEHMVVASNLRSTLVLGLWETYCESLDAPKRL